MTPPTARTLAERVALRKDLLLAAARDIVAALRSRALKASCLKDYGVNGWGWEVEPPFQP